MPPSPSIRVHLRSSAVAVFICGCLILAPAAHAQTDTTTVNVLQDQLAIDPTLPRASEEVVSIAVRLPKDGARAGTRFETFVLVRVAEGWHINAHEPSSKYLIGTALDVEPHDDLRVEAAYYPDPLFRTFGFTDDTLVVYEGEVVVILAMQAAETLPPGTHTINSRLRVQACNDRVCLRPSTVDVPIPVEIVR